MKKGFYFYDNNKDYFVETNQTKITYTLAKNILIAMNIEPVEYKVQIIKDKLKKANCEIKTLSSGRQYYEISGVNFGGYGSFVDDGNTIIFKI